MINNVDASAYIQPLSSEVIVQNTRENFLYCNMYGDLLKKKKKKLKSVRTRPWTFVTAWDPETKSSLLSGMVTVTPSAVRLSGVYASSTAWNALGSPKRHVKDQKPEVWMRPSADSHQRHRSRPLVLIMERFLWLQGGVKRDYSL